MIDYIMNPETKKSLYEYLMLSSIKENISKIQAPVPNRLYKYTNLNGYIIQNLTKNEFTISSPLIFNDIYDTNIHSNTVEIREQRLNELEKSLKMFGINLEMDHAQVRKQAQEHDQHIMTYLSKDLRIGCLSEINDSILMWSHYANNNQGICIEYDLSMSKTANVIYPIIYLEKPLDMTALLETSSVKNNVEKALLLSCLIKYRVWAYEKEWRIIYYLPWTGNQQEERIPALVPNPKCVYLGIHFIDYWKNHYKKDKQTFDSFCAYIHENKIPVKMMNHKIGSFELSNKDIEITAIQSVVTK